MTQKCTISTSGCMGEVSKFQYVGMHIVDQDGKKTAGKTGDNT